MMKYITLFLCELLIFLSPVLAVNPQIRNGADQLDILLPLLKNKRTGLVINQTSRCGTTPLPDALNTQVKLIRIFAPEHGFRGTADAGETIRDGKDIRTGLPIISLYGKNKKPLPEQLQDLDVMVFDIQDVGARFYTYISTLYYVMQACAEQEKEVIVLDRPNPCDYVDGPVLRPNWKSFVGMLPVPVLHGCTVGELAQMINGEGWLGKNLSCQLTVIPVKGWKHGQPYSLPVKPSPNLPNDRAIALYPSLCPFEGTSVSIGRGTEYPFQVIGSPYTNAFSFQFTPCSLEGFDKNPLHKDRICYGVDFRDQTATPASGAHTSRTTTNGTLPEEAERDLPQGFSLKYILEFYRLYRAKAAKDKTFNAEKEFFTRSRWFDLLMGTDQVRRDILQGKTEKEIRQSWQPALEKYKDIRKKYLLYQE
mgnify:FL=1